MDNPTGFFWGLIVWSIIGWLMWVGLFQLAALI